MNNLPDLPALIAEWRAADLTWTGSATDAFAQCASDLEAALSALNQAPGEDDVDMFWDAEDPERAFDSVHEILTQKMDSGYKPGEVFEVQCASQRANRWARIVLIPATEDSDEDYEYEWVLEPEKANG